MDKNYIMHGYEFLSSFSFCGLQLLGRQGSLVLSLLNLGFLCVLTSMEVQKMWYKEILRNCGLMLILAPNTR
jgi:hypothetical protein